VPVRNGCLVGIPVYSAGKIAPDGHVQPINFTGADNENVAAGINNKTLANVITTGTCYCDYAVVTKMADKCSGVIYPPLTSLRLVRYRKKKPFL
jgi:hypothetical protein